MIDACMNLSDGRRLGLHPTAAALLCRDTWRVGDVVGAGVCAEAVNR